MGRHLATSTSARFGTLPWWLASFTALACPAGVNAVYMASGGDPETAGGGPLLAILDTACSKTVAGHDWFESYCQLADRVGFLPEIVEEVTSSASGPAAPTNQLLQ